MLFYLSENSYYTFINTFYYSTYPASVYCKSNFAPHSYEREPSINAVISYGAYFNQSENVKSRIIEPYYINMVMLSKNGNIESSNSNIINFKNSNQNASLSRIYSGEYFINIRKGKNEATITSQQKIEAIPLNVIIQNDGKYEDCFLISYSDISNMVRDIVLLSSNKISFDIKKEIQNLNFYGKNKDLILNYVKTEYKTYGVDWSHISNDIKKSLSNPVYQGEYFIEESEKTIYCNPNSINKFFRLAVSLPNPTIVNENLDGNKKPNFESNVEAFSRQAGESIGNVVNAVSGLYKTLNDYAFSERKPVSFQSIVVAGPFHISMRNNGFINFKNKTGFKIFNVDTESYAFSFNIQPIFTENLFRFGRTLIMSKNQEILNFWSFNFSPYYDGLFKSLFIIDYTNNKYGKIFGLREFRFETGFLGGLNAFFDYRPLRNSIATRTEFTYNMYLTSGLKYSIPQIDMIIYHRNKCSEDIISTTFTNSRDPKDPKDSLYKFDAYKKSSFEKMTSDYQKDSPIQIIHLHQHLKFLTNNYSSAYDENPEIPNHNTNYNVKNIGIGNLLHTDQEIASQKTSGLIGPHYYSTNDAFINHNIFVSSSIFSKHPYNLYCEATKLCPDTYGIELRKEFWRNMVFDISSRLSLSWCMLGHGGSIGIYISDSIGLSIQGYSGLYTKDGVNFYYSPTKFSLDFSINGRQLVIKSQQLMQNLLSTAFSNALNGIWGTITG